MAVPPFADVPTDPRDPVATVEVFHRLGRRLTATADTIEAVRELTALTVEVVPGARWVSVSHGLGDHFRTLAASDEVALRADRVQYDLGTGPCLDAVVDEAVFHSDDLALDDRWSSFGPQVARDLGIRSVLSIRLGVDQGDGDLNAALNIYGDHLGAFDQRSRYLATLLATHAAVAVAVVVNREKARNLAVALDSNREIGVAMGVLMTSHGLTRDQAFDALRIASQNSNRKLRDLATEVADTGALELPDPTPGHARDPRPRH